MANIGKWGNLSSPVTLLTTELNSLATNTMTTGGPSSGVANQTNLDVYADFELVLAALSPSTGAYVAVYILEAADGTNYPAQSDTDLRLTSTQLLCLIPVGVTASTAQRVVVRNVIIPPGLFKIKLDNQTGVSLASSGNTLKMNTYDVNLNG